MIYEREIFHDLKAHLALKQVTVLTGMRRTGKTTLLRQLMQASDITQQVYFDLERIDNRELFSEKNYDNIVLALRQRGLDFSGRVLIALDEIQLVPNLPSVVKYLYDNYDIKFLLTGSSSYYLKNRFNESLAGRKKIFEVYPLSFLELLRFNGINMPRMSPWEGQPFVSATYERLKPYYEEYIQFGGFPEVVLMPKASDKIDMLQDILSSYINLDIAAMTDFKKTNDTYKLIKLLAARIGSRLDVSNLTTTVGLPRTSVENYLDLLEQSYLIRTIPVSSKSPDREIVKARKIYFLDNGIASVTGDLGSGAKFENAVFNQLHHWGEVSYYQLKTGKEIDFILDKNRAFEVKEGAYDNDLRNLKNVAQNLEIDSCFVIGRHPNHIFDAWVWGGFIL